MEPIRRLQVAVLGLVLVVAAGTVGYVALGFGVLDALYQTVTTVATVGFREVHPLDTWGKIFTMLLILVGVGTALYAFGVALEALIEGHLRTHVERRRMDRHIAECPATSSSVASAASAGRVPRTCAPQGRTSLSLTAIRND